MSFQIYLLFCNSIISLSLSSKIQPIIYQSINCSKNPIFLNAQFLNLDVSMYYFFFDTIKLSCELCKQPKPFQTTSEDGFRCVCADGHIVESNVDNNLSCIACPSKMKSSLDRFRCISMTGYMNSIHVQCPTCSEQNNQIIADSFRDGSPILTNDIKDIQCLEGFHPDASLTNCIYCPEILQLQNNKLDCNCSGLLTRISNTCVHLSSSFNKDEVWIMSGHVQYELCLLGNKSACNWLINICIIYMIDNTAFACKAYQDLLSLKSDHSKDVAKLPNIFFSNSCNKETCGDIQTIFPLLKNKRHSILPLVASGYELDGNYIGIMPALNAVQLCKKHKEFNNAAFILGANYLAECQINYKELSSKDQYFYELFIQYFDTNKNSYFFPIQVSIVNKDRYTIPQNIKRFFLVSTNKKKNETLFAKRIRLIVKLQDIEYDNINEYDNLKGGFIYAPQLQIQYAILRENLNLPPEKYAVSIKFEVLYTSDISSSYFNIGVSIAIILAFICAFIQTRNWVVWKYIGHINFPVLGNYLINVCFYLPIFIFFTFYFFTMWWTICYKFQLFVILLTTMPVALSMFNIIYAIAMTASAISILYLIVQIITVNIFFMDWEIPCSKLHSCLKFPVSIWRSYLVAHCWVKLLKWRRVSTVYQLMFTLLLLIVFGFENFARADPFLDIRYPNENLHRSPFTPYFRFFVFCSIYLVFCLLEFLIKLIYYKLFPPLLYTISDICSVSNISIFILDIGHHGYYIHGHNPNCKTEVDISTMYINLSNEWLNDRVNRGLISGTDKQVFEILVPLIFKSIYERILSPILNPPIIIENQNVIKNYFRDGNLLKAGQERRIQGYSLMNKMLKYFIEHQMQYADYIVIDKKTIHRIFGYEYFQEYKTGIFYEDENFYSFCRVIYSGNEINFIIFELLMLVAIDWSIGYCFVYASIITFFITHMIRELTLILAKVNIGNKSLLDRRLI